MSKKIDASLFSFGHNCCWVFIWIQLTQKFFPIFGSFANVISSTAAILLGIPLQTLIIPQTNQGLIENIDLCIHPCFITGRGIFTATGFRIFCRALINLACIKFKQRDYHFQIIYRCIFPFALGILVVPRFHICDNLVVDRVLHIQRARLIVDPLVFERHEWRL